MAVMDQDTFSNLSFHSDQNTAIGSSSAAFGVPEPESPDAKQQLENMNDENLEPLDPTMGGGEVLDCTVSDAHTENAGTKDAYVSYLITTNVSTIPPHVGQFAIQSLIAAR